MAIIVVLLTSPILVKHSLAYKYCLDFKYVINNSYEQKEQKIKNIYSKTSRGKLVITNCYLETEDFKFKIPDYALGNNDFSTFKVKYNNGKKIIIKYLPNTNKLLEIVPMPK